MKEALLGLLVVSVLCAAVTTIDSAYAKAALGVFLGAAAQFCATMALLTWKGKTQ